MRKLNVTNSIFIFLITSVLLVLTAQFFLVHKVVAQTPDNDWSAPENLSYSGSTTNPFMIVDETGVIHAIWEDSFLGYVYNYYDGNLWSPPEAVNFPFDPISTIDLHLMADSNGLLHAYWISIVGNNIEGNLLYSQVNMASIANPDSWRTPQVLADSVVALDGTIDSQERIHIAFVTPFQTEGLEAGAYYTRSAEGNFWTTPESLGSSPYMRTLTTENSSIDITASDINGTTNVYVTWDNRPRQKLFFIKSEDGGDSWGTPNDIVVPESRSGASIPHNIIINAKDDNLLLVWQFGQPDLLCTQHYQWSSDGGETWSETDQMMKDIFGCPQSNQFIAGPGEITLLFTTIDEQVYLLAWDGSTWSNPQAQTPLYSFTDPDTLNDVVYQCRKATLADRDQLYVIGCDGNQVGDIWLTSRLLGSTEDWFPPPSAWTEPANISEEGSVSILGNILFDNQNISHVIWNQIDFNSTGDKSSKLYYTFWDGI